MTSSGWSRRTVRAPDTAPATASFHFTCSNVIKGYFGVQRLNMDDAWDTGTCDAERGRMLVLCYTDTLCTEINPRWYILGICADCCILQAACTDTNKARRGQRQHQRCRRSARASQVSHDLVCQHSHNCIVHRCFICAHLYACFFAATSR